MLMNGLSFGGDMDIITGILQEASLMAHLTTSMEVLFLRQTRESHAPGVSVKLQLPWHKGEFDR